MVIVMHLILSLGLWVIWSLADLGWVLARFGFAAGWFQLQVFQALAISWAHVCSISVYFEACAEVVAVTQEMVSS